MKKLFAFSLFVCALMLSIPGCGGGGGPATNVMEGAEKSDLEKYEEMLKAEEAEANASMAAGMEAEEAAPE